MPDRGLTGIALRRAVVALWNRGERTIPQMAEAFGRTPGSIKGVLKRARDNGVEVLSVDPYARAERARETLKANLGDTGYQEWLQARAEAARAAHLRAAEARTPLRDAVIARWNTGELTLPELGAEFELSTAVTYGIVNRARAAGAEVLVVGDRAERGRRIRQGQAAYRQRVSDARAGA